jgi:1,4-dihydroxy-2-naphthoyl-CoA hydrolase
MSKLWYGNPVPDDINNRHKDHIGALIGIEFTEIGDDFIKGRMPVDARTHQPFGILHGGASVVLAESLGSIASSLIINPDKYMAVGIEVNASHLRPVKSGYVTGICTPIRIGGKVHVWDIKLFDDTGKMNCICRLTVAVVSR